MKLIKNDAGLQMVKEICTNMKIDKEWLINSESGLSGGEIISNKRFGLTHNGCEFNFNYPGAC